MPSIRLLDADKLGSRLRVGRARFRRGAANLGDTTDEALDFVVKGSVQSAQEGDEGAQVSDSIFTYRDSAIGGADESLECVF